MGRDELRAKLAEVDDQREGLQEALDRARSRRESIENLRRDRELDFETFAQVRRLTLGFLSPEDRRRLYVPGDAAARGGR